MTAQLEITQKIQAMIDVQFDVSVIEAKVNDNGNIVLDKKPYFRNPMLSLMTLSSITASLARSMNSKKYAERKREVVDSWNREENGEEFQLLVRKFAKDLAFNSIQKGLKSKDLPSSIFPTSVVKAKKPNYYLSDTERYTFETKYELFRKIPEGICTKCGDSVYTIYVPEEGIVIKELLKDHAPDFFRVNALTLSGVKGIDVREIRPFEYLFYVLDVPFTELSKSTNLNNFQIELFTAEKVSARKVAYSHYIIPNIFSTFYKFYVGEEKYFKGQSKLKMLILSLLAERWVPKQRAQKNHVQMTHSYVNRFLYNLFYNSYLDVDTLLQLEYLKLVGGKTQIMFLEEIMSWI